MIYKPEEILRYYFSINFSSIKIIETKFKVSLFIYTVFITLVIKTGKNWNLKTEHFSKKKDWCIFNLYCKKQYWDGAQKLIDFWKGRKYAFGTDRNSHWKVLWIYRFSETFLEITKKGPWSNYLAADLQFY